jgi:site-specific DNA recombinase
MTPTHAVKNCRRYRYYVSRPLISGVRGDDAAGLRVPAAEIEQIVTNRIRRLLADPAAVFELIEPRGHPAAIRQSLIARANKLASRWPELSAMRRRVILATPIRHIVVRSNAITIEVRAARVALVLTEPASLPANTPATQDEPILTLCIPAWLRRAGKEVRMVVDGTDPFASPQNPTLP